MADPKDKKGGLKINNEKSTVPQPKVSNADSFEQRANEAYSKYEEYKKRVWELSTKFKSFVVDSVLPENKTEISKNFENEVQNELIKLSLEMNEDDNQPQGMGSSSICMLLMKCILVQRDTINTLAFKLDKLERHVAKTASETKDSK